MPNKMWWLDYLFNEDNTNKIGTKTNTKNIYEKNDDINILWENEWNLETKNGNITVSWNNKWELESKNWNVTVSWENKWNLETKNWNITISWNNNWELESKNWNITVFMDNEWELITKNWNITISWNNNWKIENKNWLINIVWNNVKIIVKKCWNSNTIITWSWNSINIWWTCTWRVSVSSWTTMNIINWKVFLDWKEITWNDNSKEKQEYEIKINDYIIDFEWNTITNELNNEKFNIKNEKNNSIYREWDKIISFINWQKIIISEESIKVEKNI